MRAWNIHPQFLTMPLIGKCASIYEKSMCKRGHRYATLSYVGGLLQHLVIHVIPKLKNSGLLHELYEFDLQDSFCEVFWQSVLQPDLQEHGHMGSMSLAQAKLISTKINTTSRLQLLAPSNLDSTGVEEWFCQQDYTVNIYYRCLPFRDINL